jgi:4-hydroxybenzoate polyprenyltransferase
MLSFLREESFVVHITSVQAPQSILFQIKLYLALSRTPHVLLDLAAPAFAALLWYGSFPPWEITILGLTTAFAGYTSVYALNDLVDHRVDRKRVADGLLPHVQGDLDSIFVRHPIAQGLLPFPVALFWAVAWAILALAGSYLLNPYCAAIFLVSSLLEAIYCLMWNTGYLKFMISGVVKSSGAMAAVYAVDQNPSPPLLALLFFMLFFWEIGGQNINNDWVDIEEDRILRATTFPLRFGLARTSKVILYSLLTTLVLSALLFSLLSTKSRFVGLAASLISGSYLLLLPAYRLYMTQDRLYAGVLFNRASYYPLALLAGIIVAILV